MTEIKPKNYVRNITENDYKIKGYRVEHANLADKGSTRGVAIYISESLQCNKLDTCKIIGAYGVSPKEEISIELQLAKNERMIISNIYRNPSSDDSENNKVNEFVRQFGKLKCEHQVIVGDFNRKDIDWKNVATTSDGDADFIEACRDSYLTQHILQPTRGRGTNQSSLLDLFFLSKPECVENIKISSRLGKSDHSLVKVQYRSQPEKLSDKIVYNYKKAD